MYVNIEGGREDGRKEDTYNGQELEQWHVLLILIVTLIGSLQAQIVGQVAAVIVGYG